VRLLGAVIRSCTGVAGTAGFKASAPQARVLMLTVSEDERDLAAALRGGARGYLLKTMDSEVLASAIQRTMAGESVVSPEMTSQLVNAFQTGQGTATPPPPAVDTDPIHSLSPREGEILALIAKGASNKELARELNIAEATVKIHVQHILRKLNLSSLVQATVYLAGRQG
jgi:two-component system nitrate/nitrite response regulator NarL